jgi:recombination protein RecA
MTTERKIISNTQAVKQDTKAISERQKALELALAQIEKQFGKGSIMKMGGG